MLSPKEADNQEGLFRKIETYLVTKSLMPYLFQHKVLSLIFTSIFLSKPSQPRAISRMGMLKCCDTPYSSKCWTRDLEVFSSWHWSPTWPYWGPWTLNLVLNSVSCLFLLPFTYWSVCTPFSYLSVYHYLGHWRAGSRYCAWNWAVIYWGCVCVCVNYRLLCSLKDQTCMKFSSGIKFCLEGQPLELHPLLMCSPECVFWGRALASIKLGRLSVKNILQQWL